MNTLTLDMAKEMIEHAEHEARQLGVPMVIAVVDEGGNFVACHRMDDALLVSIDIAQNKAWTSVALKMPSGDLAEESVPGSALYGINTTNSGRIVLFGGGLPLRIQDRIVGAVGVSGGSVEQDVQVAEAAVRAFEKMAASV
ncbi:heme-binding protein [Aneurinibacillus sp. BA2021]|nr:heme-binding protein [Aneurinibacillus sp. BA2021]